MTAHGSPLLCLLVSLGFRGADGTTPPPSVVRSVCAMNLDNCITQFNKASGEDIVMQCESFRQFQVCYRTHIHECNPYNGEAQTFEDTFNQIVMKLPAGCQVSTTPMDSLAAASSGHTGSSASSGSSYPLSSALVLPPSGTSGGRTSGSSLIYMNWWQWALVLICVCCCCTGAGISLCARRRRFYSPDPYGAGAGPCDYDEPYAYPAPYAPEQAFPLVPGPMSYTGNMPTRLNMVQPY